MSLDVFPPSSIYNLADVLKGNIELGCYLGLFISKISKQSNLLYRLLTMYLGVIASQVQFNYSTRMV